MSKSQNEHPFAPFVRILGKGKSGTRSLTQAEARDAFGMILRGNTEPVQLGAFLMLLRVKEESPEEIAGFVEACREVMLSPPGNLTADLDWSSYAGKRHQHPWFILSALLLAGAGYRVFVHGTTGHTPGRLYTEQAFEQLGLPVAADWQAVGEQLAAHNLSYLPLQAFCAPLQDIMNLKHLLGLRSPVNTLARMINPLGAPASIQSIFHPAYARIHQQADQLLGQPRALVFKGESGEVEIKPQADTGLHRFIGGQSSELKIPRTSAGRVAPVAAPATGPLRALWRDADADGSGRDTAYGLQATLATAAAGLLVLRPELDIAQASAAALELWRERDRERLAPCS